MTDTQDTQAQIQSLERRLTRANKRIREQEKTTEKLVDELNDMIAATKLLDRAFIIRAFTVWWYYAVIQLILSGLFHIFFGSLLD